ncbi:TIR domain-containing protein [Leptothoe spongobia]|uniref:TIR domain-containing protein n=1 Tax=Leptothoe spongobia TAU-MAC 1115 TaxID=1967444 RepID=A0A947GKF0_9CYAN|nr:TIR domain-containing protein [Leptothoe spongobia]MBT9316332.1 TIR domain-containing protein [Leptothoe spongobia TAU-MAC 1115]
MVFEHDIFISFTHVDNWVAETDQQGWIDHFHKGLEIRLTQLRGEQPRIWRDRQNLQGNDYFGDEIIERLPKVALLVSVLSPRYLKSEWCSRELKHFYTTANQLLGVRIDNKSRIFKVIKTAVPLEKHPEILKPLLGYAFYEVDDTGRPREFSPIFGVESRNKYLAKLEDLAYDICKTLDALEAATAQTSEAPETAQPLGLLSSMPTSPPQPDKQQIYLAEVPIGLEDERDQIRRDLELKGYQIFPSEPLPNDPSEFNKAVQQSLQTSRLSVHLVSNPPTVGSSYADIFQQMAFARSQEQVQLAAQTVQTRSDFSRILWMPSTEQPVDEALQVLQNDPDFLNTGLEDLKTFIQDRLERPTAEPAEANGSLKVLLDCNEQDLVSPTIEPLYEFLSERFEVQLPDYETSSLAASENLLRQCDAVLIYYGHDASGLWLKRRLLALQKTLYKRLRPLLAKAVYVADPQKQMAAANIPVIQGADGFTPNSLEPFLVQVAQGGG